MQLTVAMTSNYNRKRRSLKIIAIGGALLFILPTLMLLLRIPILGYEIELEEVAKIFNPPTRAIIFGPYTPDIEPPTGLYIRDMVGRVEKGNVTSINFTLGISHGYPALDFSDARIHFTGGDCDKYYLFYPKKETDTYPLVSVIEDPDRVWKNKHLNDNATIRVTINGFNITPGNGFSMYFMVLADKPVRIEKFFFKTPPFFTEPPLDREHNGSVRIDDDGSYPKPSEDDWVVKNITSVENIALILDKNIVILENGTFVLRNSTILINSTKEKRYGIYVGYGGKLLSFNTTISAMNTTEAEYILSEYRYNFEVYGNMIMEKSNVAYTFSGMYIYSDNVWINDSTINGTIICTYASPIITNNTIYNNGTAGIGMKKSSPIIANNTLYSVGNYLGKPVGHGIGGDLDSAPLIIDNRIMNEEVGIMVSIDSSPKIMHNRISSCTNGLIFEKTYGLAENNTIENATVGISISRWASITIVNNNISADNCIEVGPWATATIIGNNISGYKKYGIAPPSYRPVFANLSMSNNNFVPDANYTNESIGAIQVWEVFFVLVDEQRKNKPEFQKARITFKGKSEFAKKWYVEETPWDIDIRGGFAEALPEYIITNEGERIDCSPYTFTLEISGWKGSFDLTVNHTTVLYVILKQKWYNFYIGVVIACYGLGIITACYMAYPHIRKLREKYRKGMVTPKTGKTTILITEEGTITIRYSIWTGRLYIYQNGREIGKLGSLGGTYAIDISGKHVEIESKLTPWLTNRTTVKINGKIVACYRWL